MKKTISLILIIICLIGACCGCGSNDEKQSAKKFDDNTLLPYGLKFGMSYDEAKETYSEFPEIDKAKSNDGYASEGAYPLLNEYESFFELDLDKLYEDENARVKFPAYYFSFNEQKELYEFYVFMHIENSESSAEVLFNEYMDYYEEKLNKDFKTEESTGAIRAQCETDTLKIEIVLEEEDNDTILVYTGVHNIEYELSE